jgi:two-component system NtrC family sensor kinase
MAMTVSALVACLTITMVLLMFSYFESALKEAIAAQEKNMIEGMARGIDNRIDVVNEALVAVSKTVTAEVLNDPNKAQAFLDSHVGIKTMLNGHIYIFSPDGRLIAESPYQSERRGQDVSFRNYFRETMQNGHSFFLEPYLSADGDVVSVMFTVPINGADGDVIGVVAGGLDLLKDNFLGTFLRTAVGKTGYIYLCNDDGEVIVHPALKSNSENIVPPRSFNHGVRGFVGTTEITDYHGNNILLTYKHLSRTDWLLVANHPTNELYAPVSKVKHYFVVAMLVILPLLILLIWYAIKHYTAPLAVFTKHVEELAGKTGKERYSSVDSNDEVGALSKAFNKMLVELDRKTAWLEKNKELYQTVTDFASDMTFWRAADGALFYISPNCERITGYSDERFYNDPALLDAIVHPEDREMWKTYSTLRIKGSRSLEFRIITAAGETRWMSCVSRLVIDEQGNSNGLRGSHQDITERKLAEQQLRHFSFHDSLTGFRNRACFDKELVTFNKDAFLPVAIMVCDVDGLKIINDTLGHRRGDDLLVAVAKIVKKVVPEGTPVYRIGGDEFVIVFTRVQLADIARYYRRLHEAVGNYREQGGELPVSISLGYAVSDPGNVDMITLFKEADNNMYQEKAQRVNFRAMHTNYDP